ncbi:putative ribosomal protein L25/L23 [Lupinus albus]|uniref:Putative ribosomal protein L25/L23 n=1 Tax=Lupinus albus TaxID=3870 RepID=A0A6A4NP01_LUPAL|nr:putative ribosomal protein L25/L23 [Lupinus albus]
MRCGSVFLFFYCLSRRVGCHAFTLTPKKYKTVLLKTIPSATKLEIKNFLQSFYNLDVQKVRTLNMKGKKKHHGGSLIAKPDYKKAYVTLNKPLPVTSNLYPLTMQY